MSEGLIFGGVVALIVATVMRVSAKTGELGWLYSLFYFGLVVAVFVGCFGATAGEATAMGLAAALSMHFINYLRLGAQQRQEQERQRQEEERLRQEQRRLRQEQERLRRRQEQQNQPPVDRPPVRSFQPKQTPPAQPVEQKKQTKVKPVVHDPQKADKKPAQKPAEKQTLKTCLRCGKAIQGVRCGYCGFDVENH